MAAGRRPIAGSSSTERPSAPDSITNSAGPMPSASAATTKSSQSVGAGDQRLDAVEDPVLAVAARLRLQLSGSNSGRGSRIASAAAGTSSPVKAGR